jgi:hypothetical protein
MVNNYKKDKNSFADIYSNPFHLPEHCHSEALLNRPVSRGSYTHVNIDDTAYNKLCLIVNFHMK